MKVTPACRHCLEKLISQTAELATSLPSLREKAIAEGQRVLEKRYSPDVVSTIVASEAHRVIREITGNPDPFEPMKRREIQIASTVSGTGRCRWNLSSCLNFAVLGNAIDFFLDPGAIEQSLNGSVSLAGQDISEIERKLDKAKKALYLADNAGECFFDLPLVNYLRSKVKTAYVVKDSPVQNDITLKDLKMAGLRDRMGRVITTGNDFVGLDLETTSLEFRREFYSADLIIAKGMGYYETISELEGDGRVVFLLKAKCQPVADSLSVPLNSCVAKLY